MRLRIGWAAALALAVSVVVGVIVVVVGRSDTAPSSPVPKAAPRSVANPTCSGPPPARTPAGDRAGFSEGGVLGGRQGPTLGAELAGIAATGARHLCIDVDWSAIEQSPGTHDWFGGRPVRRHGPGVRAGRDRLARLHPVVGARSRNL